MNDQQTVPQDNVNINEDEANPIESPEQTSSDDSANASSDRLVPVAEARRYRKRAQAAEQQLEQLSEELESGKHLLQHTQRELADLKTRQQIDAALIEAQAIDLEAARPLVEQTISAMDEPNVQQAVNDLHQRKPFLFQQRRRATAAMAPRANGGPDSVQNVMHEAAEQAVTTGKRTDLLRYLRVRRRQ